MPLDSRLISVARTGTPPDVGLRGEFTLTTGRGSISRRLTWRVRGLSFSGFGFCSGHFLIGNWWTIWARMRKGDLWDQCRWILFAFEQLGQEIVFNRSFSSPRVLHMNCKQTMEEIRHSLQSSVEDWDNVARV